MDLLTEALAQKPEEPNINITIPLALLRQDFFPPSGICTTISFQTAYLIAAADKKANHFYVEFPNDDHNKTRLPKLWLKAEYLRSLTRHKLLKYESELYRQKSYVQDENRRTLIWRICKITKMHKTDECVAILVADVMQIGTKEAFAVYGVDKKEFDEVTFRQHWEAKHGKL